MNKLTLYEKYTVLKELCVRLTVDFGNVLAFWYVIVHYTPNCTAKMKTKRNTFNDQNAQWEYNNTVQLNNYIPVLLDIATELYLIQSVPVPNIAIDSCPSQ